MQAVRHLALSTDHAALRPKQAALHSFGTHADDRAREMLLDAGAHLSIASALKAHAIDPDVQVQQSGLEALGALCIDQGKVSDLCRDYVVDVGGHNLILQALDAFSMEEPLALAGLEALRHLSGSAAVEDRCRDAVIQSGRRRVTWVHIGRRIPAVAVRVAGRFDRGPVEINERLYILIK